MDDSIKSSFCYLFQKIPKLTYIIIYFIAPADIQGINNTPWTAEEQKLLEQALKTYTTAVPDRWDKIAACLPGRSKKDCMKRYKV